MPQESSANKRVVLITWKKPGETEVFSNLKNFCMSYPQYNYNTLNNYLSKKKTPYENDMVRVERKNIAMRPKPPVTTGVNDREIVAVLRRVALKEASDDERDLLYWLSQPVIKRAEAVTFLVSQTLADGQRMDKTVVNKIRPAK